MRILKLAFEYTLLFTPLIKARAAGTIALMIMLVTDAVSPQLTLLCGSANILVKISHSLFSSTRLQKHTYTYTSHVNTTHTNINRNQFESILLS